MTVRALRGSSRTGVLVVVLDVDVRVLMVLVVVSGGARTNSTRRRSVVVAVRRLSRYLVSTP